MRVYVDNRAKPDRSAQVAAVVADIRRRVAHLDIAMTDGPQGRQRRGASGRASATSAARLRAAYGRDRARQIQKSLEPQCLSGFRKDAEFRIVHSDVFLVVDAGDFIFYDCVYEELLQSLGPINDTASVPWTMFNDDVQMGFFGVYDQYILNILYHPRVRAGHDGRGGARAAARDHARGARVGREGERAGAVTPPFSLPLPRAQSRAVAFEARLKENGMRILTIIGALAASTLLGGWTLRSAGPLLPPGSRDYDELRLSLACRPAW